MQPTLLVIALCIFGFANAQNYSDVAVVVNDNDSNSLEIGNYFASQRGIPPYHVLHLQLPNAEEVDSLGFESYRAQLESALITANLLDSINYLVTTKGLPLRVSKNGACDSLVLNCCSSAPIQGCRSADSELSKILGPYAGDILQNVTQNANPYYQSQAEFSRDSFGLFIVGRLDGLTVEDAKYLVDHGGADRPFYPPQSNMMADIYGLANNSGIAFIFSNQITVIDAACQQIGVDFVSDNDPLVFLGGQTELIGMHLYSKDTAGMLSNQCQPGALIFDGMGFSGYSFDGVSNPENSNSAWRLLRSGAGAIVANASMLYVGPSCNPAELFPYFFDTLQPWHNAGMALYYASPFVGQQQYLLGDPKTSLRPTGTAFSAQPEIAGTVQLFPNPSTGKVTLAGTFDRPKAVNYQWFDLQGRVLQRGTLQVSGDGFSEEFDLSKLPSGLYLLHLEQDGSIERHRLVIQH